MQYLEPRSWTRTNFAAKLEFGLDNSEVIYIRYTSSITNDVSCWGRYNRHVLGHDNASRDINHDRLLKNEGVHIVKRNHWVDGAIT